VLSTSIPFTTRKILTSKSSRFENSVRKDSAEVIASFENMGQKTEITFSLFLQNGLENSDIKYADAGIWLSLKWEVILCHPAGAAVFAAAGRGQTRLILIR